MGSILLQPKLVKGVGFVQTQDITLLKQKEAADAEEAKRWWEKFNRDKLLEQVWAQGATLYKRTLAYFLNQLAYDTAIKLATGDWGQGPLIEYRTFKDVVKETADNAAGYFIEDLGKQGFGGVKFNLCEPDFAIKYKITLGLQKWHKPPKPACTFSELKKNWEEELRDPDFLPKFQDMFNPWENDLGIALSLQTGLGSEVDKKTDEASLEKLANQGFKPVTDQISGFIKTPASVVRDFTQNTISKSSSDYFVYTGYAVADAIDVFINTLLGTLMEEWLDEGIVTNFPDPKSWDYDDYDSQLGSEGIAGVKERFRKFLEPNFNVRGDYNILAELTMCPDPTKAGPTNCVITDNFRQAIINKLTVIEAIEQGYLNGDYIFGFQNKDREPEQGYIGSYPYRSMPILRKFRIIPVGWEVAALGIFENRNAAITLNDIVACYSPTDDYSGFYEAWCEGMVDPNWVLKAPLNYCGREGPGPEIISEQIVGEGDSSSLLIMRNDNYCADEQSCIKEKSNGSCEYYGYCTEEKRKWQFNSESCEPKYNTCQTFRSREGKIISYLENTLDYGICSADNVGCKPYCTDYDFISNSWNCTLATVGDKLYADKDIEECDQDEEGCHEFVRIKAGLGANLLVNPSFEDDLAASIWAGDGIQVADSYNGAQALQIGAGGLNKTVDVAPTTYAIAGEIFSLSFYAKNCAVGDDFGMEADSALLNQGSNWQYYQATYVYPETFVGNQVNFTINTNSCIIDAIKLERGVVATAYSDYRENGLIYQKLAPDYLGCNDPSPPSECNNFVKKCEQSEVGCELYTSKSDNISIPARVIAQDYCPAECVGYDIYIQTETIFDSLRPAYFIPDTARTCGAEAAGCDEFTNLDEIAAGGEGKEYYSYLRQCIKPSDPAANCAEFYTWEGSDETGYQLKTHSLEEDLIGADGILNDPDTTSDDTAECSATIYALPATDPGYNSDCREFYNTSGQISYHLYKRTISCNENCHPYRRTENNIDPSLLSAADCTPAGSGYINVVAGQFSWDGANNVCYFCRNKGEWSNEHQACIYMAVPDQGFSCSAGQDGCREYSGNAGNNIRIVLNNDFEGSLGGWTGIDGATAELSSTALIAGGESLHVYNANFKASIEVGGLAQKNKSYVLSFLAISAGANQINSIKLVNGAGDEADFITSPLDLSGNWQLYKVNLAELNHDVSDDESLVIEASGDFYIDDIRLTEIIERYYLIKNSWATPDSCYEDIAGNYMGPTYNLGCDEYKDRDNNAHYLHSFSWLCNDLTVGCEIMIDTHNYSDYNSQIFNAGDPSEITVSADSFIYAVYDKDKKCNSRDKGCERLGLQYQYESSVLYSDVYLKNNPDKYNEILCLDSEAGCEEWTTDEGLSYFKDPGSMVCEWRQAVGIAAGSWGWYKNKIKRCDDNGNGIINSAETAICLTDSDCGAAISCILDNNDYTCATYQYKTLGKGGAGNAIYQPIYNTDGFWAGLCPASQAGCTEYIDPVSNFNTNLIFNPDFSIDIDGDSIADKWSATSSAIQEKDIVLEANTLYILAVEGDNTAILDSVNNDFYTLENSNILFGPINQISVTSPVGSRVSKLFYTRTNVSAIITVNNAVLNNGSKVEVKQAIVDYQLKQGIDRQSCNGIVNFEDGCVLLNERSQDGSGLAGLDWDADLTVDDKDGVNPEAGVGTERDSNQLIKVRPDRACNKWLACRSSIKNLMTGENKCYSIGTCVKMDPSGQCSVFVNYDGVHDFNANNDQDASGYVKIGKNYLGSMEEIGSEAKVGNGDFEDYDLDNYPLDWYLDGVEWDPNYAYTVNNPYAAQEFGIIYPAQGRSLLKLGAAQRLISYSIQVETGQDYYVSYMVNTYHLSSANNDSVAQLLVSGGGVLVSETDEGLYGWARKVGEFTATGPFIEIVLQAFSPSGASLNGSIYYDDIQIIPVLATPEPEPRTCKLWPETDSMTCESFDMIKGIGKGLHGYCLEYDRYPGSADSCILWYPVDRIKSSSIIEKGVGYDGKFPVYYCADMDANFDFVERRTAELVWSNKIADDVLVDWLVIGIGALIGGWGGPWGVLIGAGIGDELNTFLDEPSTGSYSDYTPEAALSFCNSTNYYVHFIKTRTPETIDLLFDEIIWAYDYYIDAYCVPDIAAPPGGIIINQGVIGLPISNGGTYNAPNNGWYSYDGNFVLNESTNNDPPVMIYNYTTGSLVEPKDYRLQCDKFYQVVSSAGDNKAWSSRVRTSSDYEVFVGNYTYGAEDPPFGSAIQPDLLSPEDWDGITSTDQYDRILFRENLSEGIVAGMPYGCHDDSTQGNTCGVIGRCSAHDQILCADPGGVWGGDPWNLGKSDGSERLMLECPGGETCNPINNLGITDPVLAKTIISSLFVESYLTVDWLGAQYDIGGSVFDNIVPPGLCPATAIEPIGTVRVGDDICSIYPIVANVILERGNGEVVWDGLTPTFTIDEDAYYTLKFNSIIDNEQLPLTRIDIDWGDGDIDIPAAYGQLNDRPNIEEPHTFEHWYTSDTWNRITVTITDNWDVSASN